MSPVQPSDAEFIHALIESAQTRKSWRERLQWVRDCFVDPVFRAALGELASLAVYLRFLATGELACTEDGRHFRPNHHAEAAAQIEGRLDELSSPETAWVLRRIYPYLPSSGEEFRRAEPLTRIRDIAHRNDIPPDLKREIKQRLQNKLHRCAGPEDLRTSEEFLARITAPRADYAPGFVEEFKLFHTELREFFNASALDTRLRSLAHSESTLAETLNAFLNLKAKERLSDAELLDLLDQLTTLRRLLTQEREQGESHDRSQRRLADIGLEDFAFTLLSECANRLGDLTRLGAWVALLRGLSAAFDNLRLSLIEPDECAALRSEVAAWSIDFCPEDRFQLLRLLATLSRARRVAEEYTDRINRLFPPRVEAIGRSLGIADHAIRVFSEGDVRGHVVFQLSRLVQQSVQAIRSALHLSPWETIVPGEAHGKLVRVASFADVPVQQGPLVLLLNHADGDAEIPTVVKGIALGHSMPMLSHLGVRARQAGVPFAAAVSTDHLDLFDKLVGKDVRLLVGADGLSLKEAPLDLRSAMSKEKVAALTLPKTELTNQVQVLLLNEAVPTTCGAKAAGARRLLELAGQSHGLFRAPRGLAIPFGVMEVCLEAVPTVLHEYRSLQERWSTAPVEERGRLCERLRQILRSLPVADEIGNSVATFFGPDARLAIRSSANGEDLESLAGAGLYESVVNVPSTDVAPAISEVWASLWTQRAAVSRAQAGLPHDQVRMAVLVQELVTPELSFIMHTTNPLTGLRAETLVEMAIGLGEVLASASIPGVPYRLVCDRTTGAATLSACATFSIALRPSDAGIVRERLDYSRVSLSSDRDAAPHLGRRLAALASFLEEALGRPQDVEGICVGEEIHVVQARPQQGLGPVGDFSS
jgi:phosphoglucan,water dikinase